MNLRMEGVNQVQDFPQRPPEKSEFLNLYQGSCLTGIANKLIRISSIHEKSRIWQLEERSIGFNRVHDRTFVNVSVALCLRLQSFHCTYVGEHEQMSTATKLLTDFP
jgi:hypothetical protein